MYIKTVTKDCSGCEKSKATSFNSKCPLESTCKPNGDWGYKKLTLKRVVSTIKVFIGNKLYTIGYNLQDKNREESYIFWNAEL